MAMPNTNFTNNPQTPSAVSNVYLPDQLIAGEKKVVSDNGTITGGVALKRGSVLGQVVVGSAGAPVAAGGNTGNAAISAITLGAKAKVGTYTIQFSGARSWTVIDPDGLSLADANNVGTPFTYSAAPVEPELGFVFTAGGTAMVAGDTISIPVTAGSLKYKLAASAALDGSQNPVAILADDADASGGDVISGIYLEGEFNANAVTFGTGITLAAARIALRPWSIYLKDANVAADPT